MYPDRAGARAAAQQPPVGAAGLGLGGERHLEIQLVELWALRDGAGEPTRFRQFHPGARHREDRADLRNATVAEMAIKIGNLTSAGPVLVSRKDRTVEHHLSARTWRVRAWTVTFHAQSAAATCRRWSPTRAGSPTRRRATAWWWRRCRTRVAGRGVGEVQLVRTSQDAMRPEVQRLNVTADRVALETQRVQLVATTSPPGGEFELTVTFGALGAPR